MELPKILDMTTTEIKRLSEKTVTALIEETGELHDSGIIGFRTTKALEDKLFAWWN